MSLVFEWNPRKARSNLRKHRVNFADAVSVFSNPLAKIFPDEEHSADESREIIVGHSSSNRLLLVSFIESAIGRAALSALATRREKNSAIMKSTSRTKPKSKR